MKIIIIILQAILNLVRKRRDLIANRSNINIPPEYRDDVVVYYSPTKQKLTNYDVIESYADDFTKWKNENTGVTSTQKKIVIAAGTKLKYSVAYKGFGNSIAKFDIKYTGNAVIRYQYNKEDGTTDIITINRSGIYHLPASIKAQKNFGFYCDPQTVTEEATIEQLPTSILKDFSGNGLDAYMYGFAGKLNSGIGIYNNDFTDSGHVNVTWVYNSKDITVNGADSFTVHNNYENWVFRCTTNVKPMTVKIVGVSDDVNFKYRYESANGDKYIYFKKDGVYELPATIGTWQGFNLEKNNDVDVNITVTQIPDYPNSLCYAGKQYCKVYDLPDIDDYTIIARRTWFSKTSRNTFISNSTYANNGGFIFEIFDVQGDTVYSFGNTNKVIFAAAGISYQTKTKYNDTTIAPGTAKSSNTIWIGHLRDNDGIFNGCHDDIIILKRSLTVDEINDITKAVFKEDILKPTFDLKATDVIDVVNNDGGGLTEYTDVYGVNYTFNNFTLGDAVGNKDYPNALYFTPNKQRIRFAPNKAIKTVIIDGIFYETCVVYDSRDGN